MPMALKYRLLLGSLLVSSLALVSAQDAPPGPTYQAQLKQLEGRIAKEYQQLISDKIILPQVPVPTNAENQVLVIIAQLRILATQYEREQSRATQEAANVAVFTEHKRQLQGTIQQLHEELQTLKAAQPSAEAPKSE
jgi:flagellar biosynthesis chaperone FliJ